jgi:hypothetical protein
VEVDCSSADVEQALAVCHDADAVDLEEFIRLGVIVGVEVKLVLEAGTTATFAHGLAAVYVGFTVAFGPIAIRWADAHFAHRFASGPAPAKAPSGGWGIVRFDLALWLRSIGAWIIALALIEALVAYVGDEAATEPLLAWYKYGFGAVVLWFIFGPVWSLFLVRSGAR